MLQNIASGWTFNDIYPGNIPQNPQNEPSAGQSAIVPANPAMPVKGKESSAPAFSFLALIALLVIIRLIQEYAS